MVWVGAVDLCGFAHESSQAYYNFYRMDMHHMLMECATGPGKGEPAALRLHHACVGVEYSTGRVAFSNGVTAIHDLVVGADGIGVGSHMNNTQGYANE